MTDLDERLTELLSTQPRIEPSPRLLGRIMERRAQIARRRRRLAASLPIGVAVAAATALVFGLSSFHGATRGPASSASHSPAGPVSTGLRGSPVNAINCPTTYQKDPILSGEDAQRIDDVQTITICHSAPGRAQDIQLHPGQPKFATEIELLSRPNDTTPRVVCLTYANSPLNIYATTGHGIYLVLVATDKCGHYVEPIPDGR